MTTKGHVMVNFNRARLKIKKPDLIISLICLCVTPVAAQAQTNPLSAIYACTAIADDAQRLNCFDRNVPVLQEKEAKKEIITIDAKQVEAIERDSFGFSLPSLPKFGLIGSKTGKEKSQGQLYQVKSLSKGRKGISVTMENGQTWQQITGDAGFIPKGKLTAKIRSASFGSFFISLTNEKGQKTSKAIRVKRIN